MEPKLIVLSPRIFLVVIGWFHAFIFKIIIIYKHCYLFNINIPANRIQRLKYSRSSSTEQPAQSASAHLTLRGRPPHHRPTSAHMGTQFYNQTEQRQHPKHKYQFPHLRKSPYDTVLGCQLLFGCHSKFTYIDQYSWVEALAAKERQKKKGLWAVDRNSGSPTEKKQKPHHGIGYERLKKVRKTQDNLGKQAKYIETHLIKEDSTFVKTKQKV